MKTLSKNISETIAENINDKLSSRGWTAYRLWKVVGGSQGRIYTACNGTNEPSAGLLRDIAKALDCTMDALVKE
jgi:transcriptional regulator with XRE-family HTH domain